MKVKRTATIKLICVDDENPESQAELAAPMPFPEPMPDVATRDELSFATAMEYLAKGRRVKRKYWHAARTLYINGVTLYVQATPRLEPYVVLTEDILACDWELLP